MEREIQRLTEARDGSKQWRRWGPFLSERQWGTVREDYSDHGNSWDSFPHDHARRRAYRWGEDGLQGWTDRQCRLCFAPALWNTNDTILKERLFGLDGNEGNHGEDVKECYYYLDSTPTHSYTKALYKYPQAKYPYTELRLENQRLGRLGPEMELADMGMFEEGRYFDVLQEVAKRTPEDLLWQITITNHGPEAAPLHVLPTLWLRNVWSWGNNRESPITMPGITGVDGKLVAQHETLGQYEFYADSPHAGADGAPDWLFTNNDTNFHSFSGAENPVPFVKDAFHRHIIHGEQSAVSQEPRGTKAAAHFQFMVPAGGSVRVRCRLVLQSEAHLVRGLDGFEEVFAQRIAETEAFYGGLIPSGVTEEERMICRQGYAGLLWTKQFFYYVVEDWLKCDKDAPPPEFRLKGRNADWPNFFAKDILSMPDKWEYPWFAAWDTAFHMLPFAAVDPDFAKDQLLLLLREWYMHPNGQLPAYEWNFSDVNPPVHAWAVWRVYKISDKKGSRDIFFLERAFQKLLLNFTWWVNRKDVEGRHVFGGGFLGLDNIGVFDRSQPLPGGGRLNQADGTAWMASYCLTMLSISLELALEKPVYEDIASKFFEHFVNICDAINALGGTGLWDSTDGFYYDQLIINHKDPIPLRIRSLVGLLPMCAVTVLKQKTIDALPNFRKRMDWFLINRPDLLKYITVRRATGKNPGRCLLAIPSEARLRRSLQYMLDEKEFLSSFGIRSLSKAHDETPFTFFHEGQKHEVAYAPGEATTEMFGGNSNWRGPIWFPINFLIIEALERYAYFYGDTFTIEYPTGSGKMATLREIALDLCDRLVSLFVPDEAGYRPCFGAAKRYSDVDDWKGLLLFHEYFHAETGEGIGASHQTGWTSLIVNLVRDRRESLLRGAQSGDLAPGGRG